MLIAPNAYHALSVVYVQPNVPPSDGVALYTTSPGLPATEGVAIPTVYFLETVASP